MSGSLLVLDMVLSKYQGSVSFLWLSCIPLCGCTTFCSPLFYSQVAWFPSDSCEQGCKEHSHVSYELSTSLFFCVMKVCLCSSPSQIFLDLSSLPEAKQHLRSFPVCVPSHPLAPDEVCECPECHGMPAILDPFLLSPGYPLVLNLSCFT